MKISEKWWKSMNINEHFLDWKNIMKIDENKQIFENKYDLDKINVT